MHKHYQAAFIEKKCRNLWDQHKVNAYRAPQGAQAFTIMMPPANVTGSLHVGHALTFTLQDILIRFHRMQQRDILWQPGTDHAGIATQARVTQDLHEKGINAHALSREQLLQHIWDWKNTHSHIILDQLKTLGASAQWERTRFTMDEGLSSSVTHAFIQLHQQGLVFRKKTLVNWDTKLQTAVSDLEIISREQKGTLYHIAYNTPHGPLVVATTRPETLFGDTALAVHPEDTRYQKFIGQNATIPLSNKTIPIIADHHADPEKGSGVVKITPAHDFNDYQVGQRHNLPMVNILTSQGTLNNAVPEAFQGLSVSSARKAVIQALGASIVQEEPCKHSVPYGDRSNTVIEPFLTDQWFVNTKPMAQKALDAFKAGRVKFFPERWGHIFTQWLENIQPWCVSRQITWGHRVPVWWSDDTTYFVAPNHEAAQESARAHYGKNMELQQDNDVLDTWFSSGLWPFATLGWPEKTPPSEHFPSNVLVTGFDIIFFWVARMVMMSLQLTDTIPFHHVYIHGLIRDEKGQKMSKSKGNVINPLAILEEYGADSLRLTLAQAASPGQDVRLSPQAITSMRNFCTKVWNTARYAHQQGVQRTTQAPQPQHPVNTWIIQRISALTSAITKALESYGFQEAALEIYHTFWHEFCDWYLEATKPLISTHPEETRQTLGFCLSTLTQLLHPFAPHITEEIWQSFGETTPLANHHWPKPTHDSLEQEDIAWFKAVINTARSYKKRFAAQSLSFSVWSTDKATLKRFQALQGLFTHFLQNDIPWEDRSQAPMTVCVAPSPETVLYITAPHMDLEHETRSLSDDIQALKKQLESISQRLATQEKAPETTKESWRAHAASVQQKIAALEDTLQRFRAVQSHKP